MGILMRRQERLATLSSVPRGSHYSLLELASGFAPSLMALLVMRALFGIAMGGEWASAPR